MPNVFLRKDLYDDAIRKGLDIQKYVNALVEDDLQEKEKMKKT